MQMLTLLIAIVGATAWLAPWIYEKYTKPQIEVRFIGLHGNDMCYNKRHCLMHLVTMNIVSLRKDFNIKDVEVSVLFKGTKAYSPGHYVWMRPDESVWIGPEEPPKKYRLNISPEDTLPYIGSLPKNKTKTVYILFEISKSELAKSPIEKLSIKFIEQTGLIQGRDIEIDKSDPEQLIWDYRIWQEIKGDEKN